MKCEAIFKGTKVDGVYDKDPKKHADAKRFDTVSYDEVLAQHLGVMDASAIALARDNDLPIIVFSSTSRAASAVSSRGRAPIPRCMTPGPGGAMREIQFWNINRGRGKPLKTTARNEKIGRSEWRKTRSRST
jgi:aspartokinase